MKHYFRFILLVLFAFLSRDSYAQEKAVWKEMHDFHDVMSATFHSAEVGKLQPLREKAGLLLEKAKVWKASAVPQGYNPAKTADTLKRLVKQCKSIKKAVKANKTDAELTTMITQAHDIFHEIMEKCRE